jgi:Rrf2 family protein
MRRDSRLSRMLHVLLHLGHHGGPATSEQIARMLGTNPVVVRRTMAGLRNAGYVRSAKGHGGGWALARELKDVTLQQVYEAIGEPALFAVGPSVDNPGCVVEQAVNAAVNDALQRAEELLVRRLGEVTLADLARDFARRMKASPRWKNGAACG